MIADVESYSTLVTGASGQIGSRCVAHLESGAVRLDAKAGAGGLVCDLRSPIELQIRAEIAGVQRVIHLAGSREDLPFASESAWALTEANAIGTAHLLAALPASIEHVLLVSSISVYGGGEGEPLRESRALHPRTAYGASKAAAEHIARVWSARVRVPLCIARVAQVYGEGTDPRNGLYRMLDTAHRGDPIYVGCRPSLIRDYIHVDDVARLLCELSARRHDGIVNLGSGAGVQMIEMANLVAEAFGAPTPVTAGNDGSGHDLSLDTSTLHALGLAPRVTLAAGIAAEAARLRETP